jgi:hypothetical protein
VEQLETTSELEKTTELEKNMELETLEKKPMGMEEDPADSILQDQDLNVKENSQEKEKAPVFEGLPGQNPYKPGNYLFLISRSRIL